MPADPDLKAATSFEPLGLLREAIQRIPQLKWAFGVVGVAAAAVIVQALVRSPVFGLVGLVGVIVAMVVLFIFSRVVSTAARATRPVAVLFMWFVMIVFMAAIGLLFWSTFFNQPWPLREKLFTQEVSRRADAAGLREVSTAAKDLSEPALLKLVQLSDSRQMVASFDTKTDVYRLYPIPAAVRELERKGLIAWNMPEQDFQRVLQRLGQNADLNGAEPQQIRFNDLSDVDRDTLREFHYRLNDNGMALYKLIMQGLVQQIKGV